MIGISLKDTIKTSLNILSVRHNKEKINIQYKSNHNRKRKNQVVLLMITDNNENWHYLAVKSISRLFRGIASNHDGDFYCLNCMHSFRADNALKNTTDYVIIMIIAIL